MKNLKSDEVLELIRKKVEYKKNLKLAKKEGQNEQAKNLSKKIQQLEHKLHSRPLAKN